MDTKKFKIFGEPWKIEWVDCILNPENPGMWRFGETDNGSHKVRVSMECGDGTPIPLRTQEITKVHELLHVILDEGQYLEESQNEPLIEWLAKCIVSLKEQKVL